MVNLILTITNTIFDRCISAGSGGAISFVGKKEMSIIIDSQFINCTANYLDRIFDADNFSFIRGCTFTHDAYLPYMGEPAFAENIGYLLGKGSNFENCTFNNLRSNKQGETYIFENETGNDIYLTLRNCTFNFQSGSAGLCKLSGDNTKLLMDGVTINNNGGQLPLIYLTRAASNGGYFHFKANNTYNGTILNTAGAITGLSGSGVLRLTNGATPVIVP
jgi:hypothetical protein